MNRKQHKDYEWRALRLEGSEPTARDCWISFYRLWRMAAGRQQGAKSIYKELATQTAFYCLGGRDVSQWVQLMGKEENNFKNHNLLPKFLRRQILDQERRARIKGTIIQAKWQIRNQRVAAKVREEKGMEVTPDAVGEVRAKIINHIRSKAREMNVQVPKDDENLIRWIGKTLQ